MVSSDALGTDVKRDLNKTSNDSLFPCLIFFTNEIYLC